MFTNVFGTRVISVLPIADQSIKKRMKNLTKHLYSVDRQQRNELNKHDSFMIWFTGLSGSGKSTLANLLEIELHKIGVHTYLLDGDNVRLGLNKDLGFSDADRSENIRRIGEIGHLMVDAGLVTIAAFVSPFNKDRERVKTILGADNYFEVYLSTSVDECIDRDTKGLYKKAIAGEIKDFTGISSPYETPSSPDLTIDTAKLSKEDAISLIMTIVSKKLNVYE